MLIVKRKIICISLKYSLLASM